VSQAVNTQAIRELYDYNCWANERILSAVAGVPAEQFASARLGYCNLRDTLVHVFSAERRWRSRWQGQPNAPMLTVEDVPTPAVLRQLWEAEQPIMRVYLATLCDLDLSDTISYSTAKGRTITSTRWHTMVHMINHGTQHRAELALLLTELGHSPGNIDLNVFIAEM
jgi:uncharacterized damage-inducible protein DinB